MDDQTREAFDRVESRFEQFAQQFTQIDKRLDQIAERLHDEETKLLSAFYDWARPVETRLNKQLPALDERLGWLEQRIAALERKNLERGI
jgi:hypothetical protein